MSPPSRCWLCSAEIQATERAKLLGDLNVPVHVGCFDRLFEDESPRAWSDAPPDAAPPRERRPPAA